MASDGRQQAPRTRAIHIPLLTLAGAMLALAVLALAALAAPAGAEVVYDNPPAADAETLGFEDTGTAELGALVRLAGAARLDPVVRVGVSNAGPAVAVPITLSLHAAAADGEPGALLARATESFELAAAAPAQPVAFALAGVTLPEEAIVSVAFDSDAVGLALAGPAAVGANPREAEGVYRAATPAQPGDAPVFGFASAPATWEGRQPAFTVEAAAAPAPVVGSPAAVPTAAATTTPTAVPSTTATTATPAPTPEPRGLSASRPARREYRIPASKRMSLSFPRRTARLAGPGALIQVRCTGASAARCIGTLSLSAAGAVHKAPYSIGKGRRQYVVVPLGEDLDLLDALDTPRVTATASTVQVGGAAVKTKRALKLK